MGLPAKCWPAAHRRSGSPRGTQGTLLRMALEHPWTEPPTPADVRAVASGIYWLRMPLPFQLNHINLWLLEDGPGWTIVDTGVGLDDTRALWERIFATHLGGR